MYKIIRQKRKSISITLDEDYNIIIKAPYYVNQEQIEDMIKTNKAWIEQTITKKKQKASRNDWVQNKKILYLGEYRDICILEATNGNARVEYKDDIFYFYRSCCEGDECIRALLEAYLREEAKILFAQLTQKYTILVGVTCNKVTIRKQKTRWGSCSSKGNLSYNIKLMCASLSCIEYVVLHEVMHLRHFDHSKDFWRDIEKIMPNYIEKKAYFKKYGQYFEI
ncbi:MAG: SprT family zinc-dependent metalloprotease [Cellulosilyticaceae bacterium]